MTVRLTAKDLQRAGIKAPSSGRKHHAKVNVEVFFAGLDSCGITLPTPEYEFHHKRRWKFDFAWPHEKPKLALEIEGGAFTQGRHTRGAGFIADMAKYNEAVLLGWRVLRCTPQQVKSGEVFDLLERIFA